MAKVYIWYESKMLNDFMKDSFGDLEESKFIHMARNIIYILPIKTKKNLVDSAWMFQSKNTIHNLVVEKLVDILDLVFKEEYLGIKKYINQFIDMNVVFSKNNEVKEISIRTTLQSAELIDAISELLKNYEIEVFKAE